jgi:hypothetical protein
MFNVKGGGVPVGVQGLVDELPEQGRYAHTVVSTICWLCLVFAVVGAS